MTGYDLLQQLYSFTPEQLKDCLGFAFGRPSMDLEGFTDSKDRPAYPSAGYFFTCIQEGIDYVENKPATKPASHPGTPTKAVYVDCPQCHARLIEKETFWYCPDCNYTKDVGSCTNCSNCGTRVYTLGAGSPTGVLGSDKKIRCSNCAQQHDYVYASAFQVGLGVPWDNGDGGPLPVRKHMPCKNCGRTDSVRANDWVDPDLCAACFEVLIQPNELEPLLDKLASQDKWIGAAKDELRQLQHTVDRAQQIIVMQLDDIKALKAQLSGVATPQEMVGGMAHSIGTPPFHLIPTVAWQELANQYALGEKYKGKDAWNAFSPNQHVLKSKEAIAIRLGHVISHAVVLLEAIAANKPMDVRDAAAVMWGGSFAICAAKAQTNPDQ